MRGGLHAVTQELLVFAAGDESGDVADLLPDIGDVDAVQFERVAEGKVNYDGDAEYDESSLDHGNPP